MRVEDITGVGDVVGTMDVVDVVEVTDKLPAGNSRGPGYTDPTSYLHSVLSYSLHHYGRCRVMSIHGSSRLRNFRISPSQSPVNGFSCRAARKEEEVQEVVVAPRSAKSCCEFTVHGLCGIQDKLSTGGELEALVR